MDQIERFPPVKWSLVHPRLAAWIVLSLGMIILLTYEARDVGLKFGNWVAIYVATILVAGACIWIVSWEDEDDEDEVAEEKMKVDHSAASDDASSTDDVPPADEEPSEDA